MFKSIKRYFKKSITTVNYELKCEKLEKKLEEANDRIKFLEKELDRNYMNNRIINLQKIIKRKNEKIDNLIKDYKMIEKQNRELKKKNKGGDKNEKRKFNT